MHNINYKFCYTIRQQQIIYPLTKTIQHVYIKHCVTLHCWVWGCVFKMNYTNYALLLLLHFMFGNVDVTFHVRTRWYFPCDYGYFLWFLKHKSITPPLGMCPTCLSIMSDKHRLRLSPDKLNIIIAMLKQELRYIKAHLHIWTMLLNVWYVFKLTVALCFKSSRNSFDFRSFVVLACDTTVSNTSQDYTYL